MNGLMMNTPLLISSIAEHAEKFHGDREIVSVTADNPRHRCTIGDAIGRAKQLANALDNLGLNVSPGPDAYFRLMSDLAASMTACLLGAGGSE